MPDDPFDLARFVSAQSEVIGAGSTNSGGAARAGTGCGLSEVPLLPHLVPGSGAGRARVLAMAGQVLLRLSRSAHAVALRGGAALTAVASPVIGGLVQIELRNRTRQPRQFHHVLENLFRS